MLVDWQTLRLAAGPKEHHSCPAVDPLFRSAALSRGAAVVAVVLTGDLDDGTAGLTAVKSQGGVAVVQDPGEAIASGMPRSALDHCEVDYCVRLNRMPALIARLATAPFGPAAAIDARLREEMEVSLGAGAPLASLTSLCVPTPFSCPECRGSLWEIQGSIPARFRCQAGHGFTERSLERGMALAARDTATSAALAARERSLLLRRMAEERRIDSGVDLSDRLELAREAVERQAAALRRPQQNGVLRRSLLL